jgi:hypothetical protein
MKVKSAIVLAVFLLALPGFSAFAAPASSSLASGDAVVYPTFAITAVDGNSYVEIRTDNLPAGENFTVTMGLMGTQGIGGYVVATTYSGTGGSISVQYTIPAALYNQSQIAIRLKGQSSGYYAYNWFYNSDANVGSSPSPPAASSGYSGIPTFSISAVERNVDVTISPKNFPPNETFRVRMNWMGTQGVAGTIAQTVTSDASGNLNDITYAIPGFLSGSHQIAIRLESTTSGYFAYNWFYNNNAP